MTAPEREALVKALLDEADDLRHAPSGDAKDEQHNYNWKDKPHRCLYDACALVERAVAALSASPAVTVTEEMVSDLRRTQQLAELALESCRYDRLKAGHGDIGGKRGTDIGLWDEEVNQRDRSRAYIKALEAALKSTTPQTGSQE